MDSSCVYWGSKKSRMMNLDSRVVKSIVRLWLWDDILLDVVGWLCRRGYEWIFEVPNKLTTEVVTSQSYLLPVRSRLLVGSSIVFLLRIGL